MAFVAFALGSVLGCAPHEVVRVNAGVPVAGRFVSEFAYASFTRGSELEARGRFRDALSFYLAALDDDGRSVAARVRVGAMACRLGQFSLADEAFAEAAALDEHDAPLWHERALCHARRGRPEAALVAARKAVAADPERDDLMLAYAGRLKAAGRAADAHRWYRALAVRSPGSLAVWQELEGAAAHGQRRAWAREAGLRLSRLRALGQRQAAILPDAGARWQEVDRALLDGGIRAARGALVRARLNPRLLAARAILLGQPELAFAEAQLRFAADPDDPDARVARALAADLLGRPDALGSSLSVSAPLPLALSEAGRQMLAELLWRHAQQAISLDGSANELPTDTLTFRQALRRSFGENALPWKKRR